MHENFDYFKKKQIPNHFFFVNFSKPDVSMQSLNLLVMNFDFDFFLLLQKIFKNLNA